MPYVCLGVRGGCFNSNTKLEMVRISTTKIGFTRPSLIYNHAMTCISLYMYIQETSNRAYYFIQRSPRQHDRRRHPQQPAAACRLVLCIRSRRTPSRQLTTRHRRTVTRIVTKLGTVIVDIKEHLQFKSQLPQTFPSAWTAVFIDVVEPPSCRHLRKHAEAEPFTAAS